jgi:hypothetical protein
MLQRYGNGKRETADGKKLGNRESAIVNRKTANVKRERVRDFSK